MEGKRCCARSSSSSISIDEMLLRTHQVASRDTHERKLTVGSVTRSRKRPRRHPRPPHSRPHQRASHDNPPCVIIDSSQQHQGWDRFEETPRKGDDVIPRRSREAHCSTCICKRTLRDNRHPSGGDGSGRRGGEGGGIQEERSVSSSHGADGVCIVWSQVPDEDTTTWRRRTRRGRGMGWRRSCTWRGGRDTRCVSSSTPTPTHTLR